MQLIYTMFISNNRASFHLWWKDNLVIHQKFSKYYQNNYGLVLLITIWVCWIICRNGCVELVICVYTWCFTWTLVLMLCSHCWSGIVIVNFGIRNWTDSPKLIKIYSSSDNKSKEVIHLHTSFMVYCTFCNFSFSFWDFENP